MWLWPWITIVTLVNISGIPGASFRETPAAWAAPSSAGPTSAAEAEILWKDGKALFEAGSYGDSVAKLQRLVDRYPGHPEYLEAHKLLGQARVELKQYREALAPLKYFTQSKGHSAEGARVKLWLCRAYQGLGKNHEALLLAEETEREVQKLAGDAGAELQAASLLARSQALMGLGRDSRSLRSVAAAQKLLENMPVSSLLSLRGEARWVELRLKTRACGRSVSRGDQEESVVISQIERRGVCLSESMLIYRDALSIGDLRTSRLATEAVDSAFATYVNACTHPPDPPAKPTADNPTGRRAPLELKRYRAELVSRLKSVCKEKLRTAIDLMTKWKDEVPPGVKPELQDAVARLEKLKRKV